MPLAIYRRSSRNHANLPITRSTALSLIFALTCLQLLYMVSYVARPFWSSSGEFPPFKHHIERWEKKIIDLILEIVPVTNYRSPNPSSILHPDSLSNRAQATSYESSTHLAINTPVIPQKAASSVFPIPPSMPQCYPESAMERLSAAQREFRHGQGLGSVSGSGSGSGLSKPNAILDRYNKNGLPAYDTVKKPIPRSPPHNRSHLSGTLELSQTPLLGSHLHSYSHSSQPQHVPQSYVGSQGLRSMPSLPRLHREHFQNTHSIEERDEENDPSFKPLHQVHNLNVLMRPNYIASLSHLPISYPLPSRASQKSPVNSLDGPQDTLSAAHSINTVDSEQGQGDGSGANEELRLDRITKCHSTESYPGQFPVSEGLDASSLATAEYAFREKGTIAARPFSDY